MEWNMQEGARLLLTATKVDSGVVTYEGWAAETRTEAKRLKIKH